MMSRHAPLTAEGLIHADSVIPVLSRSHEESLMLIRPDVPLKANAFPYLPAVVHVAAMIEPVLLFPELSIAVLPLPASKPYAAIKPDGQFEVVMLAKPE